MSQKSAAMWEFLKTLVGLVQPRSRQEKKEDRAKQLLVFLYAALCNCHKAYKAYLTDSNEFNYKQWMKATKWLVHIFERNEVGIRVFNRQLFQRFEYCLEEITLGLIRETNSGDGCILPGTSAKKDGRANCNAGFLQALDALEIFMNGKMRYEDIPNAQKGYGRSLLWYSFKTQIASLPRRINRKSRVGNTPGFIFPGSQTHLPTNVSEVSHDQFSRTHLGMWPRPK